MNILGITDKNVMLYNVMCCPVLVLSCVRWIFCQHWSTIRAPVVLDADNHWLNFHLSTSGLRFIPIDWNCITLADQLRAPTWSQCTVCTVRLLFDFVAIRYAMW